MKRIYSNTEVPVPEVMAYSETPHNQIGHPYIIMEKLVGKTAYHNWFEKAYGPDSVKDHLIADRSSPELRTKRLTFMGPLTKHMAVLQSLEFDVIGMLMVDRYSRAASYIGPSYHWNFADMNKGVARGPFASTKENIMAAFDEAYKDEKDDDEIEILRTRGLRKVLDIISPLLCSSLTKRRNLSFAIMISTFRTFSPTTRAMSQLS